MNKMNTKKRSVRDLAVDAATVNDTIKDGDLQTAEIIYPGKKIVFKIDIDENTLELCKKIANKKHIFDTSKLINQYIKDGVKKDEKMLV